MWLINLTTSLISILKVKTLEWVSVIDQKCMPRPKILDVNEGVGEALFYPCNVLEIIAVEVVIRSITLWQKCAFLISLRE